MLALALHRTYGIRVQTEECNLIDPDSRKTLDQALKGKTIVIPGILNQVLRWIGGLIPPALLSRMLGKRWRSARKNRADLEIVEELMDSEKKLTTPTAPQVISLPEAV